MRLEDVKVGMTVRIEDFNGKVKALPAIVVSVDEYGTVNVRRRNEPKKIFEFHPDYLHPVEG